MLHREPSIDKITTAVGWEPTFGLDEILDDVIRHIRAEPVLVER
jgi:nucleoside-diphosphate-sugar epimerase